MAKRKLRIIIACIALFTCIGTVGIMLTLKHTSRLDESSTVEASALLTRISVSTSTGSAYVSIETDSPQLTLYIPPYVTTSMDMAVLEALTPGSALLFRVAEEDAQTLSPEQPVMIHSLQAGGETVFSLSDRNTCMSLYIQPMYTAGSILCGLSLCALAACLLLGYHSKASGQRRSDASHQPSPD